MDLGVTARAYQLYLVQKYGKDSDNLPPEALAKEAHQFQRAHTDPKLGEAVKGAIIAGANKQSKGR